MRLKMKLTMTRFTGVLCLFAALTAGAACLAKGSSSCREEACFVRSFFVQAEKQPVLKKEWRQREIQQMNAEIRMRQSLFSSVTGEEGAPAAEEVAFCVYDSRGCPWRILACLEIPALSKIFPVGCDTDDKTLSAMPSYVPGTSLPAGGEGSHTVIAGHSGLPAHEMFDGLSRLKRGDTLILHTAAGRLLYRVTKKRMVLPAEAEGELLIKEGEDLLTLYTCAPAGINNRRLLVTGRRWKK